MTEAVDSRPPAAPPLPEAASAERLDKLFALYLETAEKASERRAKANAWMLTLNTALVSLYGALAKDAALAVAAPLWRWGLPLAGLLICAAWWGLLRSYRQLNGAKFMVLQEMEKALPFQPFARERELYKAQNRKGFSNIERWIPAGFGALYAVLALASLF